MSEGKKLVPRLRFPEFRDTEGWAAPKFGSIGSFTGGGTPSKDKAIYWTGANPWISSSDISEYGIQDISISRYISDEAIQETATKIVPANSILLVSRVGVGKLAISRVPICTSQDFTNFTPNQDDLVDLVFLAYCIKSLKAKLLAFNQGMAIKGFTKDDVSNLAIPLPTLAEQQKIADCLSSLDELIAALACKVDALKTHKKGLMQQLFPREGETQPRLRFPEFRDAGDWEEKKLSTIAELTSSKRVHLSDYVPNGIPFFRGKEISLLKNNQIPEDVLFISEEYYEEISRRYGVPKIGDILITAVGTLGNVYCIQNLNKFYFKDGNLIWMKNISEDSLFLEILLNVKNKKVLSSAIGSSQKALTMVELNKLKFAFPKKDEQQRIANCLTSLDNLITAATQELETLKTHKKALMQQLFPSAEALEA